MKTSPSVSSELVTALKRLKLGRIVDFVLSREGQEMAVAQGYFPARNDVKPPAGFPDVSALKILSVDIPELLRRDEANKKRLADLFGG